MNLSRRAPATLTTPEFYVLLVLFHGEGYAYNLLGRVANHSLNTVILAGGTLYPLLMRLHDGGYIDSLGKKPAGKSGALRLHYAISELGIIRLKEELMRLRHVVRTAENAGLFDDEMPLDIQKLLLELR